MSALLYLTSRIGLPGSSESCTGVQLEGGSRVKYIVRSVPILHITACPLRKFSFIQIKLVPVIVQLVVMVPSCDEVANGADAMPGFVE